MKPKIKSTSPSEKILEDLKRIRKHIDRSLADFLAQIKEEYQFHLVHPILFASIKDFTLREGKRLRPLLLILSYQGYRRNKKPLTRAFFNAATCIEFLHNFMLIHDDIIDRSNLRRGKPTLHKLLQKAAKTPEQEKLGYDLSIIAGDIVYALAIDAFLSIDESPQRKERALKHFIKTAAFTAMGEFIDIIYGVKRVEKVTQNDVLLNYTLKTAKYTFECPLVVGAILAGADEKDIAKLSEMGIMIGQAFQIQDDILGIFDSQKNIGKSILSDIAESKKTILVYHAYQKLRAEKRRNFLKYFTKPKKSYQDLVAIRKIFLDSGSLHYSLNEIQTRLDKSKTILDQLKIKDSARRQIHAMLGALFKHTNQIAQTYNISARIS